MSSKDGDSGDDGAHKGANPVSYGKLGGYYAKAKQRVLNRMGRRTTLTRNPRVDYISKKIDTIESSKKQVVQKGEKLKHQLTAMLETVSDMNKLMLETWEEELGDRNWDDQKGTFSRTFDPEEKALIGETEGAFKAFETDLKTVKETFFQALDETIAKPLTHCTPEEEKRLRQINARKEEYKIIRTQYSDAMIDYETEVASGGEARQRTLNLVEEARKNYEEHSDKLTESALHFEQLYREEICQRIESHFLSLHHFVRGASSAFNEFYPHLKTISLDAREQRAAIRRHVEAYKQEVERLDSNKAAAAAKSLPKVPFGLSKRQKGKSSKAKDSGGSPSYDSRADSGESGTKGSDIQVEDLDVDNDMDYVFGKSKEGSSRQDRPHSGSIFDVLKTDSGKNKAGKSPDIFGLDE
mmetsp:Transcript_7613/g.23080  ORF Transcript_7613/g.23080 Transcript_7613/m.23080 type:complete len:411 (+) Transcript_7613:83-1315(+)